MHRSPRLAVLAVLVLLVVAVPAGPGHAESPSVRVGARVWSASGYSSESIRTGGINPGSELRWRGVDSIVTEAEVDVVWKRLVLTSALGRGDLDTGVLIDEDFGADQRRRISRTRSSVEDDRLFYVSADVGLRIVEWRGPDQESRGYLDGLVGYQHWHEKYVAFGATSAFPNVVAPIASGVKVITNDYYWDSLRLGLRWHIPFPKRFGFSARTSLLPWSWFRLDDVHHLRTDLRQDPSFRDEAEGGFGVQLEASLTYRIWRGLGAELGYRYWNITSGAGDTFTFRRAGTVQDTLNDADTRRDGPFFGLQYRF